MALLFLIIAIAIFLVLMSRLIYKIIKKRMSQNNVDFELQTRPAQSPAEVV
jgi:F0F1-type ATP synthase membrane subunit b/b'